MDKTVKKPALKTPPVKYGKGLLPFVEVITLTLPNKEVYALNIEDELCLPSSDDDLAVEALRAPARLAFMDGQHERALYAVRVAETRLKELEGNANKQRRNTIEADRDGEMVAESAVQAAVDCRKDVVEARLHLNKLRLHYGLLRALRDAASHRVFILNRLLDQVAKSHTGPSGHFG